MSNTNNSGSRECFPEEEEKQDLTPQENFTEEHTKIATTTSTRKKEKPGKEFENHFHLKKPLHLPSQTRSASLEPVPSIHDKPASLVSIRFFSADASPVETKPSAGSSGMFLTIPNMVEGKRRSSEQPSVPVPKRPRGRPRNNTLQNFNNQDSRARAKVVPLLPKDIGERTLNLPTIIANLPRILPRQPNVNIAAIPLLKPTTFPFLPTGQQPNTMLQAQKLMQRHPHPIPVVGVSKKLDTDPSPELDVLRLISQAVDIRDVDEKKSMPPTVEESWPPVANPPESKQRRNRRSTTSAVNTASVVPDVVSTNNTAVRRLLPKPSVPPSTSTTTSSLPPLPIPRQHRF